MNAGGVLCAYNMTSEAPELVSEAPELVSEPQTAEAEQPVQDIVESVQEAAATDEPQNAVVADEGVTVVEPQPVEEATQPQAAPAEPAVADENSAKRKFEDGNDLVEQPEAKKMNPDGQNEVRPFGVRWHPCLFALLGEQGLQSPILCSNCLRWKACSQQNSSRRSRLLTSAPAICPRTLPTAPAKSSDLCHVLRLW